MVVTIETTEKDSTGNLTEAAYLDLMKQELATLEGTVTYNEATSRVIAGIEFNELTYILDQGDAIAFQTVFFKEVDDLMFVIKLTYVDGKILNKTMQRFISY